MVSFQETARIGKDAEKERGFEVIRGWGMGEWGLRFGFILGNEIVSS